VRKIIGIAFEISILFVYEGMFLKDTYELDDILELFENP